MSDASGEMPAGDYIKNQWDRSGTVTRVRAAQDEQERVCIMWKDGRICLLFSPQVLPNTA